MATPTHIKHQEGSPHQTPYAQFEIPIYPPPDASQIAPLSEDVDFLTPPTYRPVVISTPLPTWPEVFKATKYLLQLAFVVGSVTGGTYLIYLTVTELIPALIGGLSTLIATACASLAAGVAAGMHTVGYLLAAVIGIMLIGLFVSSLFKNKSDEYSQAPSSDLMPQNNQKSAINTTSKTTVVTIVNNLKIDQ